MRIAIVGGGISGLVAADLLCRDHEITLFESEPRVGGHTHTVRFEHDGESRGIDAGFIVFNEAHYPLFSRLLARLGIASRPTTMSFSVQSERTGLEYNGESLDTLFAQRRNLLRPRFLGMVADILRFYRKAARQIREVGPETTVGEFVRRYRYGDAFLHDHLVPMGSALWSCPPGRFLDFPIRFVVDFFANHALLQVAGRPPWRTIRGGSDRYVEALVRPFRDRIRLASPVRAIRRLPDSVEVETAESGRETFDEVVLACHADQALRMLADPSDREREILGAFPYSRNDVVLHTDASLLPRNRRAWASWNLRVPRDGDGTAATLTYHMNRLQGLQARAQYCVTLNETDRIDPARTIRRVAWEHPTYVAGRYVAQGRRAELIRARRTSFCGAYWGYGFHEDGVRSAAAVGAAFGAELS